MRKLIVATIATTMTANKTVKSIAGIGKSKVSMREL